MPGVNKQLLDGLLVPVKIRRIKLEHMDQSALTEMKVAVASILQVAAKSLPNYQANIHQGISYLVRMSTPLLLPRNVYRFLRSKKLSVGVAQWTF